MDFENVKTKHFSEKAINRLAIYWANTNVLMRVKTRWIIFWQTLGTWRPRGDRGDCGSRLEFTDIVGGEEAKLGEFPWMVLLGVFWNQNILEFLW